MLLGIPFKGPLARLFNASSLGDLVNCGLLFGIAKLVIGVFLLLAIDSKHSRDLRARGVTKRDSRVLNASTAHLDPDSFRRRGPSCPFRCGNES